MSEKEMSRIEPYVIARIRFESMMYLLFPGKFRKKGDSYGRCFNIWTVRADLIYLEKESKNV